MREFKFINVEEEGSRNDFRRIWRTVWIEEGYASSDNINEIEDRYCIFDKHSTDILFKYGDKPIGTLRIIWDNDENGLPVLNDFEINQNFPVKLVEFTLLSLKKEWRGMSHIPSLLIWKEGYQRVKNNGYMGILMAADWRLFLLLKKFFPFRQVGKGRLYEGSKTIPAFLNLYEAEENLLKNNPTLYKFFTS